MLTQLAPEVSITVPVYNEEPANIHLMVQRLQQILADVAYEVVFIDDGSCEATNQTLRQVCLENDHVKLVVLSRNFGEMAAIIAGIAHSSGQALVNLDSDLQDPPELIPKMLGYWRQGYDIVLMQQSTRKESPIRQFVAYLFYRLLTACSDVTIPVDVAEFRLMSRKAADALLALPERTRFLRGQIAWLGFKQVVVPFDRDARLIGEGHYPLSKLLGLAATGLMAFNYTPLHVLPTFGLILFLGAVAALVLQGFLGVATVMTLNLAMVSILVALSGLNILCVGIVAVYVAQVLRETRARPTYMVAELLGWNRHMTSNAPQDLAEAPARDSLPTS